MDTAINTFNGGMIKDINELSVPNNVLTDNLNGTIITLLGDEYVLLQDMGNGKVETAYLPKGYVPLGLAEHGGIIYIASYNPMTGKGQLGSFPSPERNISSDENGGSPLLFINDDFVTTDDNKEYKVKSISVTKPFVMNDIIRPGDLYYIKSDNKEYIDFDEDNPDEDDSDKLVNAILGIQNKDGLIVSIRESINEKEEDSWIKVLDEPQSEDYDVFSGRISGNLSVTLELACINGISITSNTIYDNNGKSIDLTINVNYNSKKELKYLYGFKLKTNQSSKIYKIDNGENLIEDDNDYYTINSYNSTGNKLSKFTIKGLKIQGENVITYTIIPIMVYGVIDNYSQSISIDPKKIGDGNITINRWLYMTDLKNKITNIRLGIEYNPKPNSTLDYIRLNFYSYLDFVKNNTTSPIYSYELEKNNSYNGVHLISLLDFYVPVKNEYIVSIIVKDSNSKNDEGDVISLKGLVTSEYLNQIYATENIPDDIKLYNNISGNGNDYIEDFSKFKQPEIDASLNLIDFNQIESISSMRLYDSKSAEIIEEEITQKPSNNINKTTIIYKNQNSSSIKNKNNLPFSLLKTDDLKYNLSGTYDIGSSSGIIEIEGNSVPEIILTDKAIQIIGSVRELVNLIYKLVDPSKINYYSNEFSPFTPNKDLLKVYEICILFWKGTKETQSHIIYKSVDFNYRPGLTSIWYLNQGGYSSIPKTDTEGDKYFTTSITTNTGSYSGAHRWFGIKLLYDDFKTQASNNGNLGIIYFGRYVDKSGVYTSNGDSVSSNFLNNSQQIPEVSGLCALVYFLDKNGELVFSNTILKNDVDILSDLNKSFFIKSNSNGSANEKYTVEQADYKPYSYIINIEYEITNKDLSPKYYLNDILYNKENIDSWKNAIFSNNKFSSIDHTNINILDLGNLNLLKQGLKFQIEPIEIECNDYESLISHYFSEIQNQIIFNEQLDESKFKFNKNNLNLSDSTFFFKDVNGNVYCNNLLVGSLITLSNSTKQFITNLQYSQGFFTYNLQKEPLANDPSSETTYGFRVNKLLDNVAQTSELGTTIILGSMGSINKLFYDVLRELVGTTGVIKYG